MKAGSPPDLAHDPLRWIVRADSAPGRAQTADDHLVGLGGGCLAALLGVNGVRMRATLRTLQFGTRLNAF